MSKARQTYPSPAGFRDQIDLRAFGSREQFRCQAGRHRCTDLIAGEEGTQAVFLGKPATDVTMKTGRTGTICRRLPYGPCGIRWGTGTSGLVMSWRAL